MLRIDHHYDALSGRSTRELPLVCEDLILTTTLLQGYVYAFPADLRQQGVQLVVGNRNSIPKCSVVFNVENYLLVWGYIPNCLKGGSRSIGTSVVAELGNFPMQLSSMK